MGLVSTLREPQPGGMSLLQRAGLHVGLLIGRQAVKQQPFRHGASLSFGFHSPPDALKWRQVPPEERERLGGGVQATPSKDVMLMC